MSIPLSTIYFHLFLITIISSEYLFSEHAVIISQLKQKENSYFGFSVQLQSAPDSNGRVIVGAPRSSDKLHRNLIEPGAVFSCSLDSEEHCQQFEFDTGTADNEYIQGKNYSCLGYSLDADVNIDGRVVACAPRWVNYKKKTYGIPKLNGICYHVKNGRDAHNTQKLMPLELSDLQFDGYGYYYILGEAGFTSHLVQDSETVALTALGLRNWTGSIIQYNKPGDLDEKNFIVLPKNTAKFETYSYFGYSLSSGRFNSSDTNKILYVSGAPRSDNLTGTVYMYEKLTNNQVFTKRYEFPGKQFGEYFGASLTVADLNGDGIDDVIIGAPMHSSDKNDEIGCIYVYITRKYDTSIKVTAMDKIEGKEQGGRFGTAITSVGDINKDGCEDIVIGAPYYQERGAIYLYLGQKGDKAALKFDQRILASDCDLNLRGFGFSLSRGTDIDNNKYNDLAVGAYLSGHVVVLKSRPIVKIHPRILTFTKQIDVNTKAFNLTTCLQYTTKDVPEVLSITTELSVDQPQIIFDNNRNSYSREKQYKKNLESCIDLNIKIQEGLMDETHFTMTYKINNQESERDFCKFCPIEEEHKSSTFLFIPFASGCRESICKANLKISAFFINAESPWIIGSKQTELEIKVIVENVGENAFGTKLYMHVNTSGVTVTREKICTESHTNITCDFVRPLTPHDKRELLFTLNTENLPIYEKLLNVTFSVISSSEDVDSSDNIITLNLPLSTSVKYNIDTQSEPEQLLLTENITTTVNFIHTYNIASTSITELETLDVYFLIPFKYKDQIIVNKIEIDDCKDNEEIIDANYEIISNEIIDKKIHLNCSSTHVQNLKCKKIKCDIRSRDALKLSTARIDISIDVNISVFRDEINSVFLITSLESDSEYFTIKSYTKTSLISVPKAASLTLYLIIGIVVGFILIVIVALILYKVGFFKRNRPQKPEDEALLEKKEEGETSMKVEMNDEGNDVTKKHDRTNEESDE